MDSAFEILVILLSATLMIFLILGIILLVLCIKIAKHIKRISEKAETISGKAENIAEFLAKSAVPLAAGKLITAITEALNIKSTKRKKKS